MKDRSATTRSTGPSIASGVRRADVGALVDAHPVVGAQRPGEFAVPDVDGDHLGGAAAEQDLGEASGGGAGVERAAALDRHPEGVEGADAACGLRGRPSSAGRGRCGRRPGCRPPPPWPASSRPGRRRRPAPRRSGRPRARGSGPDRAARARRRAGCDGPSEPVDRAELALEPGVLGLEDLHVLGDRPGLEVGERVRPGAPGVPLPAGRSRVPRGVALGEPGPGPGRGGPGTGRDGLGSVMVLASRTWWRNVTGGPAGRAARPVAEPVRFAGEVTGRGRRARVSSAGR